MHPVTDRHEYAAFELLVARETANGYPLTVTQSPAGDASEFCQLDATDAGLQEMMRVVANGGHDEILLFNLGDRLFSALFVAPIASLYHSSLNIVRAQGKGLRVRLCIEPPALAALPWEYLHDAQEDLFLAISPETALVRYVPIHLPVRPSTISVPLRILAVISAPKGLQSLNVGEEKAIIQKALAQLIQGGRVQLHIVERGTVSEISQAMRQFQPHVFHFIGHGVFDHDRALVILEDEAGNSKPVDDRTFREFFTGFPETRLAVLNSCQTATLSSGQSLVGMAPRILQRQLSAVVAMQYPVLDSTALVFAREFYRSLGLGYPVDAAISEARRGIYLEAGSQSPDWGTPALFLRAQDGQLFQVEDTEERKPPIDSTPSAIQDNQRGGATQANTQGGANIGGNVQTSGGDFIGRDKIIGDKTEIHIGSVGEEAQVVTGDMIGVVARDISGGIVIGSVTGDVHIEQAVHIEISPPPAPELPPEQRDFVGREEELEYYAEKVRTSGFAVICGMAGAGKTALAAVLARRIAEPYRIFWHSFHEDEGFDAIIWHLAGFLAWQGTDDLWEMLQRARQTGGRPPPNDTLLDYVVQAVREQGYLLCFDDFQFVIKEPLFVELIDRLRDVLAASELSLIITTRGLPDFIQTTEFDTLGGLGEADARGLLSARGVFLPDALIADLHKQTGGNAQLLTLAVAALQHTANPAQLIGRLVEADDIERYLMNEVDEGLNANERAVMSAVAVLLGYPGTRPAIEAVLGGDGLGRSLRSLKDRYLLIAYTGPAETEYGQHAIVQVFYYEQLGARKRKELHRRAGEYYEHEEPDAVKSARHYLRAGEYQQSARLATADVWAIINQGQAGLLRQVLSQFTPQQLDARQWAEINIARGQVHALFRESSLARQSYEQAFAQLAVLPDSLTAHLCKTRACRGMAELLREEAPQEALDWLSRGLFELGERDSQAASIARPLATHGEDEANAPEMLSLEIAALHIESGFAQINMGNYAEALSHLQEGLLLLPAGNNRWRAAAMINLGVLYSNQSNSEQAMEFYRQALEIVQDLGDLWKVTIVRHDLGIEMETTGRWVDAVVEYEAAYQQAEELGSRTHMATLALSLGIINTKQGNYATAEKYLRDSIATARDYALRLVLVGALSSLADLYLRQAEPEQAVPLLAEAESLALEVAAKDQLPEIYRGRALARLAGQDLRAALEDAGRSVKQAQELGMDLEAGMSLRVQGQVLLASGQRDAALAAFEQSLGILDGRDPYEAARTKLEWGAALLPSKDTALGRQLLQEARSTFAELGARYELKHVEQLLQQVAATGII